jgi:hypothetical protein
VEFEDSKFGVTCEPRVICATVPVSAAAQRLVQPFLLELINRSIDWAAAS